MPVPPSVLIIDDEPPILNALGTRLRVEGFEVYTFSSAADLLGSDLILRAVCVLLDLRLPLVDGLELLRRLRQGGCFAPIIIISAYGDAATVVQALKEGAVDFFEKPFDAEKLVLRIREVTKDRPSQGTLTDLTRRLSPTEARGLYTEIAPALVVSVLSYLGRAVDVRVVSRAVDHLCCSEVQDRLRRLSHVREGIIDELAVSLCDSSIRANRESLMDAIEACGAVHRLHALEACLVHAGAA